MNLDQLRIFISVAENKSFSRAAKKLYISHTTTSRSVANLEENLGAVLLERSSRFVELTAAGEVLYREGKELLDRVDAVKAAVNNAGKGFSGSIAVASVNLFSYDLHNGYRKFCKEYPEVILGMYHRDIADIWRLVSTGEADIGVTFSYSLPEDLDEFHVQSIAKEKFCIVAPIEHPLALKKSVNIKELKGSSYISLPANEFDPLLQLGEENIFFTECLDIAVVPTLESLFLQVRSGNGIALVPYPIAFEYGSNCAILDLQDIDTSFNVVIIWRKDNKNPSLPLLTEIMTSHLPK